MREIDQNAVKAKNDTGYLETFLQEYEGFILHAAHKTAGRYISKMDDQWSVSLSAFHEAIQSYDFEKGSFLAFAETVIRRRLYDYVRKQSRHSCEILIDSYSVDTDAEDELPVKYEVMSKMASGCENGAKLEIQAISDTLQIYGITFRELTQASPKAAKTKSVCGKAIAYLADHTILMHEMRASKLLPLKILEKNIKLPRKVLERHRKYIIAGAEIISGDYPVLSEYLRFVREENS
ncbi:MAG: polymerase, sigma 28 subunit, FliA/WhiG subfamily [Bacillota bacterium]|jgi:RNA polymerase sigma factor|nr:polymerase, sigma 28 subunit, FliA/WhiG subfamily [Bacillota bacterium]